MSISTETTTATTPDLTERYLTIPMEGHPSRFHYVWLRDNCGCSDCKVQQSGERRLYTASIPKAIAPRTATIDQDGTLRVEWTDEHSSAYSAAWLRTYDYSPAARAVRRHEPILWDKGLGSVPTFNYEAVVGTVEAQVAYFDAVRDYGVAVVSSVPSEDGEVERFAEKVGHVRETAFERIHNVRHDPAGYNVAHTPLELKPHTDLPSYHWPPSIQLLHFLVNEATGGESTVTDGWAVIAGLKAQDPDAFDVLCRVPVRFQLFSDDEDTAATAPLIQLDTDGRVRTFRFSNQLAQPLAADYEDVELFYDAYRTLGTMIDSDRYKVAFKTANGDLLTVHGHRVMHGRLPYDPTSGARHLQDVYMDYDDLMARRRVLLGTHKPQHSQDGLA